MHSFFLIYGLLYLFSQKMDFFSPQILSSVLPKKHPCEKRDVYFQVKVVSLKIIQKNLEVYGYNIFLLSKQRETTFATSSFSLWTKKPFQIGVFKK